MAVVCAACPVIKECAAWAVTSGVDGGFYAGYWIPWSSQAESLDVKHIRAWARRRLKDVAGIKRVGRPTGPRQPYLRST